MGIQQGHQVAVTKSWEQEWIYIYIQPAFCSILYSYAHLGIFGTSTSVMWARFPSVCQNVTLQLDFLIIKTGSHISTSGSGDEQRVCLLVYPAPVILIHFVPQSRRFPLNRLHLLNMCIEMFLPYINKKSICKIKPAHQTALFLLPRACQRMSF